MTSCSIGWPSRMPAQAGVTSQLTFASGQRRRSRFRTGRPCTTSPMALGLMIRTFRGGAGRWIGCIVRRRKDSLSGAAVERPAGSVGVLYFFEEDREEKKEKEEEMHAQGLRPNGIKLGAEFLVLLEPLAALRPRFDHVRVVLPAPLD